ncbi:MAG: N-acyl-D-amino-acid deacylase family protein [Acidimicrobiales bacterium]
MNTSAPYDLLIRGGTVVDGTGSPRRLADIAIRDGEIVAVGADLEGEATDTIDATGLVVTPGFVDVHTHYDGQASWDDELAPSSMHGVTTLVMGNCGVGFAPVRPGSEEWLIQLMEGVEDIPGAALAEGIDWQWETFPEYLDHLESRRFAVDIATQVAHGAVRGYVMGERGAKNEAATETDIEQMAAIVREAVEAGALGVSTSRTIAHRAIDGEPVPGTFAAEDELFGLGRALAAGGGGVFELAPVGSAGEDVINPPKEVEWMARLAEETGVTVTFALLQVEAAPDLWKELMAESMAAAERGADLRPQVAARPFGMLIGLQTHHAFARRPSYRAIAHLPLGERVAAMGTPEVRAAILGEDDAPADPTQLWDGVAGLVQAMLHRLYVLGDPPDYEPTPDRSIVAIAEANGVSPLEAFYDACLADDGMAMMMLPLFNYVEENHDVIREQLTHPRGVSGLSDGGAHCGMICDASIPTYLLTHWARDRSRGEKLDLEFVVQKQTQDTAAMFGLGDRGTIEVGKRADLNVIDFDRLKLRAPRLVHDLPAGGRRLVQDAEGYVATIVAGEVTRREGADTGARPGRLVRGRR